MKSLHLKPGEERRILRGHRWIFSNEIADPFSEFEPGSWVKVFTAKGIYLGSGYLNPGSLIALRLVCLPGQNPDKNFFLSLLRNADNRRSKILYPGSECYRAVFGESDGLPGLVVDRYGDIVVYQITTRGMAEMEELFQELLMDLYKPRALVFRNDAQVRELEGLPSEKGVAHGNIPEQHWVSLENMEMRIDPMSGQKTGLYLDQRDNRKALIPWAKGKRVLDLFCYNGAWSLTAAMAGAAEVTGVDRSLPAITQANENAVKNRTEGITSFVAQDVLPFLKAVPQGAFDIIILDPPAFAKSKKSLPEAKKGYTDINRRALLALRQGGLLVSCSCSYHLSEESFREVILQAAQASGRQLRLIEARGQAKDHPVLLAMPETSYLKCLFLEVI